MTDKLEDRDRVLLSKMEEIADEAAERAVTKTLIAIGIDASDPLRAQRDFALWREMSALAASPEFRKDLEHIRRWRKMTDDIQAKGVMALVGILVTGAAAALWIGLQDAMKRGP